ncbi:uncharacterized protein PV07_05736 [Cladophialophora immunda]|uniref:DUF3533 domain-containing protein n=1 Tax=Cladophialophora immunda TaxID=569365 RepID=A0A0D2AXE3_9EURO|nr:uncharacterized protein PV07_05736 [Cladophialophora immunda]KIW29952.1 hypothetical protein PV07_05736 [Cladophialophora immunda]
MEGNGSDHTLQSERAEDEQLEKQCKDSGHEKDENQALRGTSGDEERNSPEIPPLPVGLFDPSLKGVRKEVAKKWALTVLILFCFILCVLSLYWAVLFHVPQNLSALTVAVVSFDGRFSPFEGTTPLVGDAVKQPAREQASLPAYALSYRVEPPEKYGGDPIAVRQAVYDEHVWAAIIVNANATVLLQRAVASGNSSYSPLGGGQIFVNSARDETTYANYINPQLFEFRVNVVAMFGEQWNTLNPAIGFSSFDLRPFAPAQATPAVTIGLIYLIIIAFVSFSFFLPVYTKFLIPKCHPPLHFWALVLFRLFMTTAAYLLMSLAYSLVSLAFLIPFSNKYPHNDTTMAKDPDAYGHATFVGYWMLNWVGMYALGLASENVTMIIGQPWTALWLIFWVISNVSTAFYAISLAPGFFQFGYAWPLYRIVNASRTILFDTHSRIGLNLGVLLAWRAVNILLFPFRCVFMRWKTNKELMRTSRRRKIQYLVDG